MPITKDPATNKILYTPPVRGDVFSQTGVASNGNFAVCDKNDQLKQIKLNPSAQATNTTVTIASGASTVDTTITLPVNAGTISTAAFKTIQVPNGTSPVATGTSDVLTLTSSNNSVTITGTAATDTIDLKASGVPGGVVNSVQTNGGAGGFAGSAAFTFDGTTVRSGVFGDVTAGAGVTFSTLPDVGVGSGLISFTTGAGNGNGSGAVNLTTGNETAGAVSGNINITTGNSPTFQSGTINISTGTAGSSRGGVTISSSLLQNNGTFIQAGLTNFSGTSDTVQTTVLGFTTQTNNLSEWRTSANVLLTSISGTGAISSPGGQTAGEHFGALSTVTGASGTALGYDSHAGTNSSAYGRGSSALNSNTVAFGYGSSAGAIRSFACGALASAVSDSSFALGNSSTSTNQASICLGFNTMDTAANQLIIGGATRGINDVYIGEGVTVATPAFASLKIQPSGSSGTNVVAPGLILAAGRCTGSAAPSTIALQTGTVGGSGTVSQTLATRLTISDTAITAALPISSSNNISVAVAGQGLLIKEGANARMGTSVLVGGTVSVVNTSVTATTRIFLTTQVQGGTPGALYVASRVGGASFVINSTNSLDTSTVAWLLMEPA